MAKKKIWHRVKAPIAWRPKENEELVGIYLSSEVKTGQYGEYDVHYIKTARQVYYVSGTMTNDLFDLVEDGSKVKIVYVGKVRAKDSDHEYKLFELYSEAEIEFKIARTG